MNIPYHVRIAISQYGNHFRAEIFTEDLGDTEGDLISADWSILEDGSLDFLNYGQGDFSASACDIGKELFVKLLGGEENRGKWRDILHRKEREQRPIRVLIDTTTDAVRNLPFGLLYDDKDACWLFRDPLIRFVRIIRRCTPRSINLERRPLRMLLAVAEPSDGNLGFEAARHLLEITRNLPNTYQVSLCIHNGCVSLQDALTMPKDEWEQRHLSPFVKTTKDALKTALKQGNFDILHVLAHGRGGDKIILCDPNGNQVDANMTEVVEWCKGNLQMAFLQACKASYIREDQGAFGGIAQQLLNPKNGNLAVVVASPYPIDAEKSTPAALDFYTALSEGKDVDEAINRGLEPSNLIWAFLEVWVRPRALGKTGTRGMFQFVSPYRGLARFEERDADIFFGRENDIRGLIKQLETEPIVKIIGDSGSGKSSLLRAGLASRIRQHGLLDHANWQICTLTPGHHPIKSLLAALNVAEEANPASNSLLETLHTACSPEKPLLLLFDQFEEILTLCKDTEERKTLTMALGQAAQQLREYFRVVLAMRSDYVGRIASLPGIDQSLSPPWLVKSPTCEQFRKIIEQPATHCGYRFEGALDDKESAHSISLLDRLLQDPLLTPELNSGAEDSSGQSIAPLPLIEFALEYLWSRAMERGSYMFTHQDYDKLGGLSGAIATHAEDIYRELEKRNDLGDAPQEMMERVMVGLVSARGTSRPRHRNDLEEESGNVEQASRMIDHLVGERLLTLRASRAHRSDSEVELAHEVIAKWLNEDWFKQDPETRAFVQEYQEAAEKWDQGTFSFKGRRRPENRPNIEQAKNYLDRLKPLQIHLTATQQAFADELAAMRAKDAEGKEQLRTALEQASSRAIQICVRNGTEAIKDGYLWGAWVWFAEALRLEALRPETQRNGSEEPHRIRLASVQKRLPKLCYVWFHDTPAKYVAFSPCGTRMLTYHARYTGDLSSIYLWDYQNHNLVAELLVPGIRADRLAFSADGSRIIAAVYHHDYDTHVVSSYFQSWLSATGEPDVTFRVGGGTEVVTFDPTGQWVLTCDAQTKLQIWDVISQKPVRDPWQAEVRPREHHNDIILDRSRQRVLLIGGENIWIWDLADVIAERNIKIEKSVNQWNYAFGSGRLIVATYGQIMIIDPNKPDLPQVVLANEGELEGINTNPDGELVLTTLKLKNDNLETHVWSTSTGAPQGKPILHEEVVERWEFVPSIDRVSAPQSAAGFGGRQIKPFTDHRRAIFAPDGRRIVTISERKNSARVWDWRSGEALTPPISHLYDTIEPVAFSNDGCFLATAAADKTTRLWNIVRPVADELPIRSRRIDSIAIAPDDSQVAFVANANTFVWDSVAHKKVFQLEGNEFVKYSPDGRFLVTGKCVWDASTGKAASPPFPYRKDSRVTDVVFSSDGSLMLTLSAVVDKPGVAQVWDMETLTPITDQLVHEKQARMAAFSPDKKLVLTVSRAYFEDDTSVILWEIASGQPVFGPIKHESDRIDYAAFSPDSDEIWTYSGRQFCRWNTKSGLPVEAPVLNQGFFRCFVAVSPDGKLVLTTGGERKQAQIIDSLSGQPRTPQMDLEKRLDHAVFSSDGKRVLTVSEDEVRVWHVPTGELLAPPFTHPPRIKTAVFNSDASRIVIVAWSKATWVYSSDPSQVYIWYLSSDTKPSDADILYSQASSQHKIDSAGGFVPLGIEEYRIVWKRLCEEYPEVLRSSGRNILRDILWHQQQGEETDDFAKKFHLDQLVNKLYQLVKKLPNEPHSFIMRADYLRKKGMYSEALADYSKAIELNPNEPQLYRDRGLMFLRLNKWRNAVDDLSKAHGSSDPQQRRQSALIEVAAYLRNKGMHAEAIKYYSEAIQSGLLSPEALWGRGQTYCEMGEWQSAAEDLLIGLDEKKASDGYLCAIVTCKAQDSLRYRHVCQRMLQQLDSFLQTEDAIERWNNTFYVALTCILGANATDDWDALRACLGAYVNQAKPADKIWKNANLLLGAFLYRSGDYDAAIGYLDQSAIHPDDWLFLAMTHYRRGDKTQATHYFNQAHDLLNQVIRSEDAKQRQSWSWQDQAIRELLELESQQLLEDDYE